MLKVASTLVNLLVMFLAVTVGCAAAEARRVKKNPPPAPEHAAPVDVPPSAQMKADGKVCMRRLTSSRGTGKSAGDTKIATPIVLTKMQIGGIKLTSICRKGPFR